MKVRIARKFHSVITIIIAVTQVRMGTLYGCGYPISLPRRGVPITPTCTSTIFLLIYYYCVTRYVIVALEQTAFYAQTPRCAHHGCVTKEPYNIKTHNLTWFFLDTVVRLVGTYIPATDIT